MQRSATCWRWVGIEMAEAESDCRPTDPAYESERPAAASGVQLAGHLPVVESPADEIHAGDILEDCYEVRHRLGQGGMATVYAARDISRTSAAC